jgi:ribosome-associated protein
MGFIFEAGSVILNEMDSRILSRLCRELAENKKAENVVVLDVRKLTQVTDYFIFATGTSVPHVRAIVDEIDEKLRVEHHVRPQAVDGAINSSWIVIDYGSVIVHVMREETRQKYDLESLWSDAPKVKLATRKRVKSVSTVKKKKAPAKKAAAVE